MAFVIHHPKSGVLLFCYMGFSFWGMLSSPSDKVATFESENDAYRFMDSWRGGCTTCT